jgi:hypothetical protein
MESKYTMFCVALPESDHVIELAPRVRGVGEYAGEYGYALALDAEGKIRCAWDDGGEDWVPSSQLIFLNNNHERG